METETNRIVVRDKNNAVKFTPKLEDERLIYYAVRRYRMLFIHFVRKKTTKKKTKTKITHKYQTNMPVVLTQLKIVAKGKRKK